MDILEKYSKDLENFCKANKIKKLSLFGSYLKNNYNEKSDIDFLVEFESDSNHGLLDIAKMERELSEIMERKVDLRTPAELSKYFRDTIVKEAEIKYEAR
jgi:predicted nucleotidyltransferase